MGIVQKIRSIDFYRKIPSDLTEATLFGATLSMFAAILMVSLFFFELTDFMTVRTETSIIVDRSVDGDLLRINFNLSFPALSCEHASVDVSDTMGNHRVNLTKTVQKYPLDKDGRIVGNVVRDFPDPKYEELKEDGALGKPDSEKAVDKAAAAEPASDVLTTKNFADALNNSPILMVNFYAPWCPWSRRLAPVWDAAAQIMLVKFPVADGRIKLAKVDCTTEAMLCRQHHIQGFPSVRIFRAGKDQITHGGHHDHESYVGDRTTEAIVSYAEKLVPPVVASNAPKPEAAPAAKVQEEVESQTLKVGAARPGCSVQGFVLVKKVPGNLHISAHSHKHSFDFAVMNMTHVVHHLSYGKELTKGKWRLVERLHKEGLMNAWSNRLQGRTFLSSEQNITHEHYNQVVMTSVEPRGDAAYNRVDLYEYTHHSHAIKTDEMPVAKFRFDPSPMQVLVKEEPRPFYHFITTVCAIIGGVFTVAGIADSSVFTVVKAIKKNQLGKQW